ncbi:uncharacterized protein LTR77_008201 [Saxophila tyrrhenica]|uniref:EXPERA domain-containing protein n=1 Tax=Saxophila tyrrhenica TaxID=1690608 RepID=A0AAV9P2X9_9PEZI|nr:hypothetical protein LTR77_008201 [Saxophila tyrrhenica]
MATQDVISFTNNMTSELSMQQHPYYPLDSVIPNYVPNTWPVLALLAAFFGVCTVLFSSTYYLAKSLNPRISRNELVTIMWFVLSGSIHLLFESYYTLHFTTLGSLQTLPAQLWKEYAFSDSRYLTANTMVLSLETMTAVCWGPGCLIVAWLIMRNHSMRYPAQMVVSVGQAYGDAIYYATSLFDEFVGGVKYSRPEGVYYWGYFVLMNAFWIVVPGFLVYQAATEMARAVRVARSMEERSRSPEKAM